MAEEAYLNPIPVRVQNKRDVPHFTIRWPFLECNSEFFEALTGRFNVIDGDSVKKFPNEDATLEYQVRRVHSRDMAEASARVSITGSIAFEVGIHLCAVIVS